MTDRYAVFGNPIKHSKSPDIHQHFALQTNQDISYERILAPLNAFETTLKTFFNNRGQGCNITVPFKQEAFMQVSLLTDRAERSGAVNTIIKTQDGKIKGDNTDGAGLLQDILVNIGCEIKGKTILLLGAGGAVRGVLQPFIEQQPKQLHIANRTASKADILAKMFADLGDISTSGYNDIPNSMDGFDIVINGTSTGLNNEIPPVSPSILNSNTLCYDMFYAQQDTAFITWAKSHGCQHTHDGLGMLVEQAAEAFSVWRGVRPDDTKALIQNMRTVEQ